MRGVKESLQHKMVHTFHRPGFALGAAIILALLLPTHNVSATGLALEEISPHFSTNTQIEWKAPPNQIPDKLWVYKTPPRTFSRSVISNAIVLASLQDKRIPLSSDKEVCKDYDSCPCGHACTFSISPKYARVAFVSPGFRNGSWEDIPSEDVVLKRAYECAAKLGVDPSQFGQKRITTNKCEYDSTGKQSDKACSRGLSVVRRVDGIDFQTADDQGFLIEFGAHGSIRSFSLAWHKLERFEFRNTASPEQIVRCIRAFKTPVVPPDDDSDYLKLVKSIAEARKLIITNVTLHYSLWTYGSANYDEAPRFTMPIAEVNATAELPSTNMNVRLFSPVLSSEVERLVKTNHAESFPRTKGGAH